MTMFPLQAFLTSLKESGIRITVRDYERIATVLQTGEVWTLPRLRDTLMALLSKDVEQQEIFLRRFRQDFRADLQEDTSIDIERALAELHQLAETKQEQKRAEERKKQEEQAHPSVKPRQKKKIIAAAIAGVGILMALMLWHFLTPEARPEISLQPALLNFGEVEKDQQATQEFTIENSGSAALIIEDLRVTGIDKTLFTHPAEYTDDTIPPGDTLTIPVTFQPSEEGIRSAVLEILSNAESSPHRITLSGEGFTREPIAEISPNPLIFAVQSIGTTSTKDLRITNTGRSPLHIKSVEIEMPGTPASLLASQPSERTVFSLASRDAGVPGQDVGVPIILDPGEEKIFSVEFTPDAEGGHRAMLEIEANTKQRLHRVELRGRGIPAKQAERTRLYPDMPVVNDIVPTRLPGNWQPAAIVTVGWFGLLLLYIVYLRRWRKLPADKPAEWSDDEKSPRHFPLGSIGGEPKPRFDDDLLNELADSMGYFQSQQAGRELNVFETIKATIRKGGIPEATFFTRKQVRSLLILEDALAESRFWNGIAGELAQGMSQRGVKVVHGRFSDSPEHFKTPDGSTHLLEDFEDLRQGFLVLIFTDGKRILRRNNRFLLEALARWPMIAWMEMRESHFWDKSTAIPVKYDIPIYPATPQGIFRAIRRFLTEQAMEPDDAERLKKRDEQILLSDSTLDGYIEHLLGEALPWAQECAMLQPSFTLGLADALRREFHTKNFNSEAAKFPSGLFSSSEAAQFPSQEGNTRSRSVGENTNSPLEGGQGGVLRLGPHIPYDHIQRLLALPGTTHSAAGIRFSEEVLKVLRNGFLTRRSEEEQRQVMQFLLQQVNKAEPDAEGSLAYLAGSGAGNGCAWNWNPTTTCTVWRNWRKRRWERPSIQSLKASVFPARRTKSPCASNRAISTACNA